MVNRFFDVSFFSFFVSWSTRSTARNHCTWRHYRKSPRDLQMEALSHVPAPPNHPPTPAATQAHADAFTCKVFLFSPILQHAAQHAAVFLFSPILQHAAQHAAMLAACCEHAAGYTNVGATSGGHTSVCPLV
jgi:hypothetical protein